MVLDILKNRMITAVVGDFIFGGNELKIQLSGNGSKAEIKVEKVSKI